MSSSRRFRAAPAAAVSVFLAVAIAACSADDEGLRPEVDHVRAVVLPYLTLMPYHIAAEEGYFAEQRLDVEFIRLPRQQEVMTALARGDVDVSSGILAVNELSLSAMNARVRAVSELAYEDPEHCPFFSFLVRREHLDSGVLDDPARIRGLRIDADVLLPFGYWLDVLLEPQGLNIDELDIVNLPSTAGFEALINGSLDLSIDSEPYAARLVASGEVGIWRQLNDLLPGYPLTIMFYGPTLLDERPGVGERFATAMLRAVRQFGEGPTPRNLAIAAGAMGLDPELLASACWPAVHDEPRVDVSKFLGYQHWSVARGLVDRVVSEGELADHRFIDRAIDELAR